MATGTLSKRNGVLSWLLGISGTLFTGLAIGSFWLLWQVSGDVATIAASMQAMSQRVDRMDSRWSTRYDRLNGRLRDVERGPR